jgi:hypothetical protein
LIIYWFVFGILLRHLLEKKLPYFKLNFSKVKKETLIIGLVVVTLAYIYIHSCTYTVIPLRELLLNTIFFALMNGCLEQLILINIYDLAGCKIKLTGFFALLAYTILIYSLFWGSLLPVSSSNYILFVITQSAITLLPIVTYAKTHDLTIWSIMRVLYNLAIIYFCGFGINVFL